MPRCAGQTPGGFIKSLFLVVFFEVVFEVMFWSNLGAIFGSFLVPILVKKAHQKQELILYIWGSLFGAIFGQFQAPFGVISGGFQAHARFPPTYPKP